MKAMKSFVFLVFLVSLALALIPGCSDLPASPTPTVTLAGPYGTPLPTEICDGVDQDGDGLVDEGLMVAYQPDEDRDGYGAAKGIGIESCSTPKGYAPSSDDCNDGNDQAYPGAAEICDGVDNDCDGEKDEGCP